MKRIPFDVRIQPASNGVIVKVGCTSLVYSGEMYDLLASDIDLYLRDHDAAIKKIDERWGLKVMEGQSGGPVEVRPRAERVVEPPSAPEEATEGQELTADQEDSLVETAKEEKRARR